MKKSDLRQIEDISRELSAGLKLLMSDEYAIMRPTNHPTTTDIFTAPYYPGKYYRMITKDIGNQLVPMFSAIKSLEKLLNQMKGGDKDELRDNIRETVHQPAIDWTIHPHDPHRQ